MPKSQFLGHHGVMPYSWLSEALDLAQMVTDIQTQVKITIFIIPNNFFSTTLPISHSLGHPRVNALLLGVPGFGPHPDGHGQQETTKINLFFIIPNNFCFKKITKK